MSLKSIIDSGTKVWLDGIEPNDVRKNRPRGISGATSNPIIISEIIKAGGLDEHISKLLESGDDDSAIAWKLTDHLVRDAQEVFRPVWEQTKGDDGYVSFELDPLLEDAQNPVPRTDATKKYIELAKQWSAGHKNRMIKIPATDAGLDAMEEVAAAGVTINVTLIFSERQYKIARDNIWRGAQRRKSGLNDFKSVYSIFISRVDVYTEKHVPELTKDAQGKVGLLNAKELWKMNKEFWADKKLRLHQEFIFASTGKKLKWQEDDYYVAALVGSDIQTNPPATNEYVANNDKTYTRTVDQFPPKAVIDEIHQKVDVNKMEQKLMEEGTLKFADPQKALLKLIAEKRSQLTAAK
jgi:transaldolase